jgi:hypothetical protein
MVMSVQNLVDSLQVKLALEPAPRHGFAPSRQAFLKGVYHGEAAKAEAVLQVFGVERVAAGFEGRSHDQRLVIMT